MGKGEQAGTLMAHYHLLLDADYIPHDDGQSRWDLFRPASAGPVEPGRPGFGWAFVSSVEFATREHAAHYACKYLLKQPEKGFPDWVLDSHGEVKRYWTSKGFYKTDGDEKKIGTAEIGAGNKEDESGTANAKVQTTIRERIAKCGKGTVLLQLYDAASIDNDVCLKPAFVERFGELDLSQACEFLGIDVPSGVRRVESKSFGSEPAAAVDEWPRRKERWWHRGRTMR